MSTRQLLPAAPGFRAAYVLADDPRDVGLVPVVAWAVPDVEVTISNPAFVPEVKREHDPGIRAVALVLSGEDGELVPAKQGAPPGCGRFLCVLGPDDRDCDVRTQAEQEYDAEQRGEAQEQAEEDAAELSKLGLDVTPAEALQAREFLGGIHIRSGADPSKPGKMNEDDRAKLDAILVAIRLRFPRRPTE